MLEELVSRLSSNPKFLWSVFFAMSLNLIILAWNNLSMVFYFITPEFYCKESYYFNDTDFHWLNDSNSEDLRTNTSICIESSGCEHCEKSCDQYEYITTDREWTVVSEWDLVCDWSFLPSLLSTVYFLGTTVGGVVFGHIADRFGRKPVILFCIYAQTAIGIFLYANPNLWVFLALRFLLGVVVEPLAGVGMILLMEFCPTQHRTTVGACYDLFFSMGSMTFGGIAYFLRHWRYIQLAISLPCILSCMYLWLLPESVRWLLTNSKVHKAYVTTQRISKLTGLPLEKDMESRLYDIASGLKRSQRKRNKLSFLDLLKTPELRKRCLIVLYVCFTIALCYYGILLNMFSLSGDIYINFIVGAALEFGAYVFVIFLMHIFGRRNLFAMVSLTGGATSVIGVALSRINSLYDLPALSILSSTNILISKAAVSACFGVVLLYMNELFPTIVRSKAFAVCIFAMRVGSLLAPQMTILGQYTDRSVPFIMFGVLLLVGGLLTLLLPETKGAPMPDTIQDVEKTRQSTSLEMEEQQRNTISTKL